MATSQDPTVAVIMRTKDRPILLARAFSSVGSQSYKDYQLVIVNDGGDKKTLEEQVAKQKEIPVAQITVIHNDTSLGMQAASNKGIKESASKYVVIHDDDDAWHNEFLAKTVEVLESGSYKGVVTPTDIIYEELSKDGHSTELERRRYYPDLKLIGLYDMFMQNYTLPISFIFERSVFKEIGYFDEGLAGAGDWDFGLRFIRKYDVGYIDADTALSYYYLRPDSTGLHSNSVYGQAHEYYIQKLRNKYMREDIEAGKLGMGYMINSVYHEIQRIDKFNSATQKLVEDQTGHLNGMFNEVLHQVQQLTSMVKIGNRNVVRKALDRVGKTK